MNDIHPFVCSISKYKTKHTKCFSYTSQNKIRKLMCKLGPCGISSYISEFTEAFITVSIIVYCRCFLIVLKIKYIRVYFLETQTLYSQQQLRLGPSESHFRLYEHVSIYTYCHGSCITLKYKCNESLLITSLKHMIFSIET